MKTFIVQCRLGPHEFFISQEAPTIGDAIISVSEYLMEISPNTAIDIYAVQEARLDIVIEDIILN